MAQGWLALGLRAFYEIGLRLRTRRFLLKEPYQNGIYKRGTEQVPQCAEQLLRV